MSSSVPAVSGAAFAALALLAAPLPAQEHAGHEMHPAATADSAATPPPVDAAFSASAADGGDVRVGTEVELRLRLTEPGTGRPLTGAEPMAWVDVRLEGERTPVDVCRQKVGAFTEGTLHVKHGQINIAQPVDDLNGHFLLALGRGPHVVVIDPVKGFGKTRLLTTVPLPAPGVDWAISGDERFVYVAVPDADRVVVVNTHSWKEDGRLDVGPRPSAVAVDPHTGRLWIATGAGGGDGGNVVVVDPETRRVLARVDAGQGPHSLAFSDDGAHALVLAQGEGALTVVDPRTLEVRGTVATGPAPVDVAWAASRGVALVADRATGAVSVVDPAGPELAGVVAFEPGITALYRPPPPDGNGAHGGHGPATPEGTDLFFVLNPGAGRLTIWDAAAGRVVRTLSGAPEPDQVAFSSSFAYVRAAGSANVALIPLANPLGGAVGPHDYFPAGAAAPGRVADGLGEMVVPQPGMHDAVYVANPAERMIYSYHYMEGMPIPHGGLTTYGFTPRAIRAVSRRMREVEPGVYAAILRPEREGPYDLIVRSATPYLLDCFAFEVAADGPEGAGGAVHVARADDGSLRPGRTTLRLRLTRGDAAAPLEGVEDARVQLASPTGWWARFPLTPEGGGVYAAEVEVPEEHAVLYGSFASASLGVGFRDLSPLVLRVETAGEEGDR